MHLADRLSTSCETKPATLPLPKLSKHVLQLLGGSKVFKLEVPLCTRPRGLVYEVLKGKSFASRMINFPPWEIFQHTTGKE